MNVNNYIRYNDNLEVSFVKIDSKLYNDIDDMIAEENVLNSSTILHNDFSKELDAYYFSSSADFLGSILSIYRKTKSQANFDFVCSLDHSTTFKDYNIHNNDFYEYMAVVSLQKSDGTYTYRIYENKNEKEEKVYLPTNWNNWSISNIEETTTEGMYTKTGDTWILGLNLEGESLTQNLSITTWDTLGRYPKLSIGERDYITGAVTCLLGRMAEVKKDNDIDNNSVVYRYTEKMNRNNSYDIIDKYTKRKSFSDELYSREIEKYLKWKNFCNDGSLKLLKDIKGNAWIVQINANPESNFNTQSINLPTTVTFNWTEVLNIDDVSIIV